MHTHTRQAVYESGYHGNVTVAGAGSAFKMYMIHTHMHTYTHTRQALYESGYHGNVPVAGAGSTFKMYMIHTHMHTHTHTHTTGFV